MPGLGKEDVNVVVDDCTLIIDGESPNEEEFGDAAEINSYTSRIRFFKEYHKMDQIQVEMKNGVLKVVVPKFTEEDHKKSSDKLYYKVRIY